MFEIYALVRYRNICFSKIQESKFFFACMTAVTSCNISILQPDCFFIWELVTEALKTFVIWPIKDKMQHFFYWWRFDCFFSYIKLDMEIPLWMWALEVLIYAETGSVKREFFGLTASSVIDFISAAAVEMSLRMKSTLSGHSSICPISHAARQCL